MRPMRVAAPAVPEPSMRTVPDDADALVLQVARLRTCPKPELGRAILDDLRQRAKDDAGGNRALQLALARAEIQFGDAERALAVLVPSVAADDPRAEAHYLLGRGWSRRAEALFGDEQRTAHDKARAELIKAYRLKKDDPPTLYHLARALSRNGVDSNVLNAARGARTLAPMVPEYAALAAWAELQAGDRQRAVYALTPLAHDVHRPELAARMRQALEAIKAGKPAADVDALLVIVADKAAP
jgi:tetratricopeptide (TPR) repeat protein